MTTGEQDPEADDELSAIRKMIRDQREANEQLVRATLRAEEASDEAQEARARAEQRERELRTVAEFREMFVGILGHDLRTPLASIGMSAGLLLERGQLDEQDTGVVRRIVASTQRMSRMITQLLDLTHARLGGGLPIEARPTDLRDVCHLVVEEFGPGAVRLELEGDVTGFWDPDRLTQALSNIAGNAIEHAAPETAVVIDAHADGAEIVIEIRNEGKPIPAEVLPYIFEPFRRGKQREKSKAGNLGLGLYIAKQVALAHGGRLDARSADGTTTFVMRMPRQARAGQPQAGRRAS